MTQSSQAIQSMNTHPSTRRFSVVPNPAQPDSLILTILYRTPDGQAEFAHCWRLQDSTRYTMSRGSFCLACGWHPVQYTHPSLDSLLDHLEGTFDDRIVLNKAG